MFFCAVQSPYEWIDVHTRVRVTTPTPCFEYFQRCQEKNAPYVLKGDLRGDIKTKMQFEFCRESMRFRGKYYEISFSGTAILDKNG